jgi:hypothetical protein|tara:strand:- start:151 stop:549 length:399 start_codon:yes stop_codon:yes gene_type:complete
MAYVSQEMKKELSVGIKRVLKKYGMKANIGVKNHMSLYVDVMSGPINFDFSHGEGYSQVNTYWIDDHYKGIAKQFLNELLTEMKGKNYYNNDNAMIDYFDRSHYTDINIGKWNKPYKLDIENMGSSMLPKVA